MPKKKKPEEKEVKIDLGHLGFSFGGIFKGLGNLIDMASQLQEKAGKLQKEGKFTIPVGGKELKGIYGFSIRTLADGKPVVHTFGNKIKETPKGPVVDEVREPLVDVFDEKDYIRVVAELPGVAEEEIKTELSGDILTVSTSGERKYAKEVLLPSKVKTESMARTFKNGVLEIKFAKGDS